MGLEEKPDPRGLAEGHKRLGVRFLNIREFNAAINEFLQALNLAPDDKDLCYFIASAYRAAGKLPQAIELLEKVREGRAKQLKADHPEMLSTLNNLASTYYSAGNLPRAIALYAQVRVAAEKRPGFVRVIDAVREDVDDGDALTRRRVAARLRRARGVKIEKPQSYRATEQQ